MTAKITLGSQVKNKVENYVGYKECRQIYVQVNGQVYTQVREQIWDRVWSPLRTYIEGQIYGSYIDVQFVDGRALVPI